MATDQTGRSKKWDELMGGIPVVPIEGMERSADGNSVILRLKIDPKELLKALDGLREGMLKVGKAMNDAFSRRSKEFSDLHRFSLALQRSGRGEGEGSNWQSYMCAAWLHSSCPDPRLTECACTCHGGHLK